MKRAWLNFALIVALFGVMFSLLSSQGGWGERLYLEARLAEVEREVAMQEAENAVLQEHIDSLHSGHHAIETVARYRLGMIQEGEVFVQFLIERPDPSSTMDQSVDVSEQPIESPLPFNRLDN
ncbi:septum formation initiator family protein [Thiomicrospira sp. ALE5]|uniref:FtsB family cell division protein n=1 Tax=Thiomicrospira sp. ALE5 TaxID=748650 RepID=UPI0008DFAC15|nr:septum formation initiator family protein [Thiomicrospira sp. ALE5]SFR50432.1 cell division protein FtsB [Thiomicrospira sp. ALE5]